MNVDKKLISIDEVVKIIEGVYPNKTHRDGTPMFDSDMCCIEKQWKDVKRELLKKIKER